MDKKKKADKFISGNFDDDFIIEQKANKGECVKTKPDMEIKVIVLEVLETKGKEYRYRSGLLPSEGRYNNIVEVDGHKWIDLGKTPNTKVMVKRGQILTVAVEKILLQNGKLNWLNPRVIDVDKDRIEPHSGDQIVDIADQSNVLRKEETGNIDYKLNDSGKGVLQLHIMGIEEDELKTLEKISTEAKSSSVKKLKMLFKGAIGEKACHIDFRLVRKGDDYFEGGELMIGNFMGLNKITDFLDNKKLRFNWKVAHSEDPWVDTIKGPTSWMNTGSDGIETFKPGKPGGSANKYGAMLQLDAFNWKLAQADEHAKKFDITGSKLFGNRTMLIAYVPVQQGRVWMISLLKEDMEKSICIIPLSKEDEHIVTGIVYEPDEVDSQGDTTDEEEIRKACHSYMEEGGIIKLNHKGNPIDAVILENWIAPQYLSIEGRPIKKGTWLMTIKVNDENIWKGIKDGDFQGFSMAGFTSGEKFEE